MKKKLITVSLSAMALVAPFSLQAWTWRIENATTKTLLVQTEVQLSSYPYFILLKSGQKGALSAIGCLGRIKYVIIDNQKAADIKLNLTNADGKLADNSKVLSFVEKYYKREEANVWKFNNEFNFNTANAAKKNPKIVDELIANKTIAQSSYNHCSSQFFILLENSQQEIIALLNNY